jgi:DNA-binding IscR family transcriptional regulator
MMTIDEYILGDAVLHERFRITTEILGVLVSNAPHPVGIAQLESSIGQPARKLAKLCAGLSQAMLLQPAPNKRGRWMLACDPGSLTLEDVFRCVIAQPERSAPAAETPSPSSHARHDVDLLVMQATMAINQSLFRHLRQFSLDRLKASATAPRRTPLLQRRSRYHDVPILDRTPVLTDRQ